VEETQPHASKSEAIMAKIGAQFVGVELYFEDLERAKDFYVKTLGLNPSEEQPGHHAKFDSRAGFICLEQKGVESYPSRDKAVLFFEVADLHAAIEALGHDKVVHSESNWAALHDPEHHNVLLLQSSQ
jgi:predicted enzyme related to lactoylglutathione lyase